MTPASALFDAAWYLGQYPEVAALEDCDPLTHYLRRGAHEVVIRTRCLIHPGISSTTPLSAPTSILSNIIWNLGRAKVVIRIHCLIHPGIWSRTPLSAPTSIRSNITWNLGRAKARSASVFQHSLVSRAKSRSRRT